MFYCKAGKHTTEPGQKEIKVPVEYREKTYMRTVIDDRGYEKTYGEGKGYEIVREVSCCEDHAPSIKHR